jgi:membrane-bound serine protease (ClpP class)
VRGTTSSLGGPGFLCAAALGLACSMAAPGAWRRLECAERLGPDAPISAEAKLFKCYLEEDITPGLVQRLTSDIRAWLEDKPTIQYIVIQINTPGGDAEAAHDLADFIYQDLKGTITIAFIPPGAKALSEGALVAVAAGQIVMGADSRMGAAAPLGLERNAPGESEQSDLRSRLKTCAEARGYPTILTDAMVSKDHDDILKVRFARPDRVRFYTRNDYNNISPEDRLQRVGEPEVILRRGELLVMNEKQAKEYGFAKRIAADLTELRAELMLPVGDENVIDARSGQLKSRFPAGQALVDFFNKPFPRFLLLLVGCLGVLIELKAFGIMIPALVAVACFSIFFATSILPVTGSLEGTASILDVLLFVLGTGLIAVEFLLLPGMAVFAVTGGALCLVSLILAMVPSSSAGLPSHLSVEDAITVLALGFGAATLSFLALLRFLPHNPLFARKGLVSYSAIVGVSTADSAQAAQKTSDGLVGRTAVAVTALRPSGKVETDDGLLLDAVAEGEFVEKGITVKVIECRVGQVRVVRASPGSEPDLQ